MKKKYIFNLIKLLNICCANYIYSELCINNNIAKEFIVLHVHHIKLYKHFFI